MKFRSLLLLILHVLYVVLQCNLSKVGHEREKVPALKFKVLSNSDWKVLTKSNWTDRSTKVSFSLLFLFQHSITVRRSQCMIYKHFKGRFGVVRVLVSFSHFLPRLKVFHATSPPYKVPTCTWVQRLRRPQLIN